MFPPYGATESLPVACLPCREILGATWEQTERGAGVCVAQSSQMIPPSAVE